MNTKKISIIGGIFILAIIILAIPAIYDTDNTYAKISNTYGNDFAQQGASEVCENNVDGVAVKAVPFGVIATTCHDEWFVLFNIFTLNKN